MMKAALSSHWKSGLYKGVLAAAAGLSAAGCTAAANVDRVRSYLKAYEESGLSCGAVLLARGDSIVFNDGFGFADLKSGLRNTAQTRFRIGSITKSMTWAAIDRLNQSGKLDLDASVAGLIGAKALPPEVTVRHLLTHQGGVADWSSFADASRFRSRDSSLEDLAEWVASKPLTFAPGTSRSYSNSGYILLARVVETVSGRRYGDYLKEEVFAPLGMQSTQHAVEPMPARTARGYASGHRPTPIVEAAADHPSILAGSGSAVSTIGDLFIWSRSAEAHKFPWDSRNRHGRPVTFMGGFVPGFGAWVEHYSQEDLTIIVLANLNNGAIQKMVPDLGAILLGKDVDPPVRYRDDPVGNRSKEAFSGSWVCERGPRFTIQPAGERLEILWRHRPPAQPLWAQSDTVLFYPQDWARIVLDDHADAPRLSYEAPSATAPLPCVQRQ